MVPNLTTSEDPPQKVKANGKRRRLCFFGEKTNMEAENQWLEDAISFLNGWFSVLCVSFRGSSSCSIRRSTKTPSTQKENHEPWHESMGDRMEEVLHELRCRTIAARLLGLIVQSKTHGVTDLEILTFRPIKHIYYGLQLKEWWTLSKACVILHPNRYCFNGLFHSSTYSQLGSRVISCDFQGKNRSYCYIQYPNTRCPDQEKKGRWPTCPWMIVVLATSTCSKGAVYLEPYDNPPITLLFSDPTYVSTWENSCQFSRYKTFLGPK